MIPIFLSLLLWLRIDSVGSFSLLLNAVFDASTRSTVTHRLQPLYSFLNDNDINNEIRDRQVRDAILQDIFLSQQPEFKSKKSSFVSLSLVGQAQAQIPRAVAGNTRSEDVVNENKTDRKNKNSYSFGAVVVLAPRKNDYFSSSTNDNGYNNFSFNGDGSDSASLPVLFIPLTAPIDSRFRLLNQAYASKPISSWTNLLLSNLSLINRDESLFDNIPWNKWSKDPFLRNRDQAGNFLDEKMCYGKRDAYNRFQGKDVNFKTVTASKRRYWESQLTSHAARHQKKNQRQNNQVSTATNDKSSSDSNSSFSLSSLSQRVLELRLRELRMEVAEVDSLLAIAHNKDNNEENDENDASNKENEFQKVNSKERRMNNQQDLESLKLTMGKDLQKAEKDFNDLLSSSTTSTSSNSSSVFDRITRWTAKINSKNKETVPPYRGATGYAPRLNDKDDDTDVSCYCSPYDLLIEILSDQLNAEVIDCVLEDICWLDGTIVLGGAIVLRRRTKITETELIGETIQTPDRDEDYGNGIIGGDIYVVDCDVDEAIGMALSCDLPVRIEKVIYEQSSMTGSQIQIIGHDNGSDLSSINSRKITKKNNIDILPLWKVSDSGMFLHVEDDGNARGGRLSPVSIPKTTSSLFDRIFTPTSNNSNNNNKSDVGDSELAPSPIFPSDNPIKSINELDIFTDKDKAKTLLEMSNFSGRIPRPRTVRNARAGENPLDKLLLPRIDESVRNEYKIREAKRRGDVNREYELKAKISNLQKAKEKAAVAMEEKNLFLAHQWKIEAQFLETLRADVTQDEGAYSRSLDRDDWYERDRQRTAKRTKKSSFGNLLDGME